MRQEKVRGGTPLPPWTVTLSPTKSPSSSNPSTESKDESNLWETGAQKEEGKIRDTSQEARMEDTSLVVR